MKALLWYQLKNAGWEQGSELEIFVLWGCLRFCVSVSLGVSSEFSPSIWVHLLNFGEVQIPGEADKPLQTLWSVQVWEDPEAQELLGPSVLWVEGEKAKFLHFPSSCLNSQWNLVPCGPWASGRAGDGAGGVQSCCLEQEKRNQGDVNSFFFKQKKKKKFIKLFLWLALIS